MRRITWLSGVACLALVSCAAARADRPADELEAPAVNVELSAAGDEEAKCEKDAKCEKGECPADGTCADGKCPAGKCEKPAATTPVALELAEEAAESAVEEDDDVVRPTHKQTLIIKANNGDLPQTTLHSFCLAPSGNVLAACGNGPGEVRVFSPEGEYVETWEIGVRPDAINVGSDGNVYIAGGGKLLRLSPEGEVLHEADSPHAAELLASTDKIREQIVQQSKRMAEQFSVQIDRYDKMIAQLEKSQAAKIAAGKELTAADKKRMEVFVEMKEQQAKMAEQYGGKEPTEEDLEQQVKSSMEYKSRVASISETGGEVFIACYAAAGHGFNVWRLDENFENGEVIVRDLSGCCGQMDVQACEEGVFVAENGRHRVAAYDREGNSTVSWGKGSRTGLDGFGSCCNPMNVAFGPDGSVYTAESEIGRIKRFSATGEMLDLVGKVDIVPGCKKVAIAVDSTGDSVYMLDISRHHIVKMERLAEGEKIAYSETRSGAAPAADGESSSSFGGALLRIFGGN